VSESYVSDTEVHVVSVLTKAEAAYQQLRERIVEGSLAPGSTINQERLAADLGLSITPLREALRRLEAEELVSLSAHKIVRVMPLSQRELYELCLVRGQLDPLAATLAAAEATEQEAQAIVGLAAQPAALDLRGRLVAHRRFHLAIYAASHNKVMGAILRQLWDRTDRYRILVLADHGARPDTGTEHQHQDIARAILARQGQLAASLMSDHVEQALRSAKSAAAEVESG
jgi:DNA-binding GntR family transcriptional regulator